MSLHTLHHIVTGKAGLSEAHYLQLLDISEIAVFPKKHHLIRKGAVCQFIGFVAEGVLRSYVQNQTEEYNNDFYFPGSFVSAYTSFVTQKPGNSSIQALSRATVFLFSRPRLQALLAESDDWYRLTQYISDLFFIRKCRRETSFLTDPATEKYRKLLEEFPDIEQQIPQYHIASYLGIKPESLSRLKHTDYLRSLRRRCCPFSK